MENDYLDHEEQEFVESFERGEWASIEKENQIVYGEAAKKSMQKSKRINIRLTQKDYHDIQVKALEEGIPYQTLISSIIHKYNKGELKPSS